MSAVGRERVDSPKNDRVRAAMKLHGRRERERQHVTLIEGVREIERAVAAGVPVDALWHAPGLAGPDANALAMRLESAGVEVVDVADAPFARLSRRQAPDGVIAVARPLRLKLADLALPAQPLLLVAVGVEKPGNLGALARSADAAAADALIVVDAGGTDLANPHAIRASMGSIFVVPTVTADAASVLGWLADRRITLVATSPAAEVDIWDAPLRGPVAIVLGPEHEGLDPAWIDAASVSVRVPMAGAADSLNVSVTGALLLFEAMRQRRAGS